MSMSDETYILNQMLETAWKEIKAYKERIAELKAEGDEVFTGTAALTEYKAMWDWCIGNGFPVLLDDGFLHDPIEWLATGGLRMPTPAEAVRNAMNAATNTT